MALSLEATLNHVLGSERRLPEEPARDLRRLTPDLRLPDRVPRALERRLAGLPFVHEAAEAVDVGPQVERDPAEELLGRGVRRRAEDDASAAGRRLQLALSERRRDAPVADGGPPHFVEENVLGLEVAVHDVVLDGRPVQGARDAHDRPVEELGISGGHLRSQASARHPARADDGHVLEGEDAESLDDAVADGKRQPDLELGQKALEVLLVAGAALKRFQREAGAGGRLSHACAHAHSPPNHVHHREHIRVESLRPRERGQG